MHEEPTRQTEETQAASGASRRDGTQDHRLASNLTGSASRSTRAASVCHRLPDRPQSEPVPSVIEEHPELHSLLSSLDGRDSIPSLEASRANDHGLSIESPTTEAAGGQEYYPEESAKSHTEEEKPLDVCCPSFFTIAGRCECNHQFAKETFCGREWCRICGVNGSDMHERRKSRWYPKLQQCETLGYGVITIPPESRDEFRKAKALSKFGTAVTRLLKRNDLDRGVRRWHFFGEQEGDQVPEFHPHINFLVDEGYIEPERLESIKRGLSRILGVSVDRVNVHYEYSSSVPLKLHWIKYVTRATFLDWRWDEGLARELVGFRNATPWGIWKDKEGNHFPPVWDIPVRPDGDSCAEVRQVADLEENRCPFDGTPITWKGFILRDSLTDRQRGNRWYRIGGGYWTNAKGVG